MKQLRLLLPLLIIIPLLFACSSSNDNKEPTQDYTSFVFVQKVDHTLENCKVGHYRDGKCILVADLGDISLTKQPKEVKLDDNTITEIYLFYDTPNPGHRSRDPFVLIENKRNILDLTSDLVGVRVDKGDPSQYPQ